MSLTQKEKSLLQDLKNGEKLCAEKYESYSNEAADPELRKLFKQIQHKEETHYSIVNEMLGDKVPTATQSKGQQTGGNNSKANAELKKSEKNLTNKSGKENDKYMCEDCLSMEKHISSVYDTSIFEFENTEMRNTLNKIQKDEQHHGEQLAQYIENHNMYC